MIKTTVTRMKRSSVKRLRQANDFTEDHGESIAPPSHASLDASGRAVEVMRRSVQILRAGVQRIDALASVDELIDGHFQHIGRFRHIRTQGTQVIRAIIC